MKFSASAYYSGENRLYHNHCQAMGTRLDILIHNIDRENGDFAFEKASDEIFRLEDLLSRYRPEGATGLLNQLGNKKTVIVQEELFSVLTLCRDYHIKTLGLFDIGIGKVTREAKKSSGISLNYSSNNNSNNNANSDNNNNSNHNSSSDNNSNTNFSENNNTSSNSSTEIINNRFQEEILHLLERGGIQNILLDPEKNAVRFKDKYVEIDFGGFGKGYALDRINSSLKTMGISDAFISFGDSSVLAIGNHPHGEGWKSGISDQLNPGESIHTFILNNESMSTSGLGPNNSKVVMDRSDREVILGHIIHPRLGLVFRGLQHISVVSPSAVDSEVLSTALFAAEEDEKQKLMSLFPDCRAVEVSYDEKNNTRIRDLGVI